MSHSTLYQTLSQEDTKKPFTKAQLATLHKKLQDDALLDEKKAILVLICEHARLEGKFTYTSETEQTLPYDIAVDDMGDPTFDLESLPPKLRWILFKFLSVIENSEK